MLADEINRRDAEDPERAPRGDGRAHGVGRGQAAAGSPPPFVPRDREPDRVEGVFPLPEAQLDRFLMKLVVKMPDLETLATIGARADEPEPPSAVTSPEELLEVQRSVRKIPSARRAVRSQAGPRGAHPGVRLATARARARWS